MLTRKKRHRPPNTPIAAYSVPEFCQAHGISVPYYYVMRRKGLAPREMFVGRRRLISMEAAAEWRKARETV
jgi:hypothetical protein